MFGFLLAYLYKSLFTLTPESSDNTKPVKVEIIQGTDASKSSDPPSIENSLVVIDIYLFIDRPQKYISPRTMDASVFNRIIDE